MRLLFDCTELSYYEEYSGHRAGVFNVALNLYREFTKAGIDITFICDYKRYYFFKNLNEFKKIPLLKEHSVINRFWGILFYLLRNFPLRIKYFFLILARFYEATLYRIDKQNAEQLKQFDAYFSPFSPPSKEILAAELKRFRMIHDIIPILECGMPKSPKDWYYRIYKTIRKNDFYVTNSDNTRDDVIKYFNIDENNIKTTLLGANSNFYPTSDNSPIEGKYVFSLCTLGKRKNIEFGIKCFFEFIEQYKINDLKLVIGGSVWKKFEKTLYNSIKHFDQSKIFFAGYLDETELAKYYSNALCFIYPSLYEGFGLPVLEAMQCGCPVITSNNSSLPEVIGDCGIQINPSSEEEMISAYRKMYFENTFREDCKTRGLQRAGFFSWEKCANEILDFIKQNTPSK